MSCLAGLALGTEQKPQPRVHQLPRIMKVAAPRWKHSWMLGQRADSHTVCRLSCRNPVFKRFSDSKCVRPVAPIRAVADPSQARECLVQSEPADRSLDFFTGWNPALSNCVLALPIDCVSLNGPTSTRVRFLVPGLSRAGKPCSFKVRTTPSASACGSAITCQYDPAGGSGRVLRGCGGRWRGRCARARAPVVSRVA